jgi:hydroxymethylpyrimidine/phosphomethylpyrimidine kinase
MNPPVALTIAGSDSGGGAGIQADLKTFAALGVFGTSALTAITAQNTVGVRAVHSVPADVVVAQVEAVLDDLPVAAVKTGMLGTVAVVEAIGGLAAAGRLPRLVVDPVMVASSGDRLLEPAAERCYLDRLLPHATVLTPNLREAEVLLGQPITTLAEQREAAAALAARGPSTVVIKGGHPVADTPTVAVDVVWHAGSLRELSHPRLDTPNNHGSGCTFAAATAALLAHGHPVDHAVEEAKAFTWRAVRGGAAWSLGRGHGPLDHFGWVQPGQTGAPTHRRGNDTTDAKAVGRLER